MAKVNSFIGIEFDSHEIRAVELTKGSDGSAKVSAFGKKQLSENVITGGIIADSPLFVSSMGELLKNGGFNLASPAVIGVNNENVIMRYATFPKVPDDKLKGVITMQAQDFIPVPVTELELDFVVIDETVDDDDQPAINVLLVGARKTMIQNLITNFEETKLTVTDIDSAFLAWARAAMEKIAEDETVGLLKLNDDVLNFVAVSGKEIKMVRSINIPDRASVEVKRAFNAADNILDSELDTIADLLYSELSSSINYYQMQTGAIISSVLFSSSTVLESKILERLSAKAYVPLTIPELCDEYTYGDFNASDYASCISLAKAAMEG